jgi:hypothetical protein
MLIPNAKPFVSCSQACSQGSNFDYIGQQQQQQQQQEQTVLVKRKFGESKQEDIELYQARKGNDDEEPPRKKHCTMIKFYFRNPFIPPKNSNVEIVEQLRESKSKVEEQPSICENIMTKNKRDGAPDPVKRSSLGPATNKAKVHKHNDVVTRNAKKVAETAAKAIERIKLISNINTINSHTIFIEYTTSSFLLSEFSFSSLRVPILDW